MKRFLIITVALLTVLGGISGGVVYHFGLDKIEHVIGGDDPRSIAERFWRSTLKGNQETASWYMKPHKGLSPTLESSGEGNQVVLGSTHQQDGFYFIDTTLYLQRVGGNRIVRLKTVLSPNQDGDWEVDFWSSQQTAFDAGLEDALMRMVALLANASAEFPHLANAKGGSDEEALKYAGEHIDSALKNAKEKILLNYSKQLDKMKLNSASAKLNSLSST